MREIQPGLFHWSAFHSGIGMDVGSHYVRLGDRAIVIDPMEPEQGLDWFRQAGPPDRVVLTNRHHYRHSDRFVDAFGCRVTCHASGLHEFDDPSAIEPFEYGDELIPGVTAREVGAICPDDGALHIAAGAGALAFADGLVHFGELGFVPDSLIGEDPEGVKEGIRRSLTALLDSEFDSLLFAHGDPLARGGRAALERFLGLAA